MGSQHSPGRDPGQVGCQSGGHVRERAVAVSFDGLQPSAVTSMDADPNMYPILIPPASNTFTFAITHSLITANPTVLNPLSIIHHSSSMATPDIEVTQLPSRFSRYSIDSPPRFAHLLIQSSDPVLKTTHAIGDTVQFETYPAPCIFLGMK